MIRAIPQDVPKDLRQSLAATLEYGNEYSQRKRFKVLIGSLTSEARELIKGGHHDFADKGVDIRNYYTHYTKDLEKALPKAIDLIHLNWHLKAWLWLLLLRDFEIETCKAVHAMKSAPRWGYFLSRKLNI